MEKQKRLNMKKNIINSKGLKFMASTSIPWLYLPIIKSKKNATKWVDANNQDLDLEVDYLPWGWGQPNYHSKQNCTVVRSNLNKF